MNLGLKYDNIHLPQTVYEILEHDFWILENVNPLLVKTITSPVKFSAFTSIFVTSGSCSADINLISHRIEAPAIVNISSSHIMQPYDISDDFMASFVVMSSRLRDGITSQIMKDTDILNRISNNPVIHLTPEVSEAMQEHYSELRSITEDTANEWPFQTIQYSILAFFFRWMVKCLDKSSETANPSKTNHIVERFKRLVQENFRKERFLDFYAERLEITPKHLSRLVKANTGFSAVEWINQFVILEAKVMLSSTNMNVQQIAEELNFPSQSFFGKYFKKATGMSPKEFRNQ